MPKPRNLDSRKYDTDVTILMPCLNESESLPYCIDMARNALAKLKRKGLTGEILISDNGSEDGSQQLARQLGCRVVECFDKGYGNAIIYGSQNARGKYIIMGDADGSYDFSEAVPMIEKLRQGYDLCMGSRMKGKILPGAMPWKNRYIGNPILTGLLNLFYRSGFSDAHCGLRAYTKEALKRMKLVAGGMELASEMVVKATILNLKRTEVPITLYPDRRNRAPHLNPWKDGWRHLKFLLIFSPLWLFFVPALILLVLSSFIFILLLFFTPPGEVFSHGFLKIGDHWAILAGGMMASSVQIAMFGLGSLIYSINNQYRRLSPKFLRKYLSIKLEYMLICGVLFMLAGFGIIGYIIYIWSLADYDFLYRIREMTFATVLILIGLQVFFSGFFFSVLGEGGKGMVLAREIKNNAERKQNEIGE